MSEKVTTPFRYRDIGTKTLLTNEIGDYGLFDKGIVERMFLKKLTNDEESFLSDLLIQFDKSQKWKLLSLSKRIKDKVHIGRKKISYILIIPTLRCDLSCSYCQVSRAPINAKGFDWDRSKVHEFEKFLGTLDVEKVKIEFQGGEPTLRPDLIKEVIDICEKKFSESEFVICSNLMTISKEMDEIYRKPNVLISTSIDGPEDVMDLNRTQNRDLSNQFFKNFKYAGKEYGLNKISALPTITEEMLESPQKLIDLYISFGFESIFLRPVNYMGFARSNFAEMSKNVERWNKFYRKAIDYIIDINKNTYFEEFYFSLILKNVVQLFNEGYVDFRSPNFYLHDFCVIDFDGKIYPSDEARMLSRVGHVDLSVGELGLSIDVDKVKDLNIHSMNQVEQDCLHCAYMPYCGIDLIDDLSRYNRVDYPKLDTWFCKRHIMIFDLIFEKIASRNIEWLDVFLKWIFRSEESPQAYEIFYDKAEF